MDLVVLALLIAFPLVGIAFGRWPVVFLPAAGWALFYLGLNRDWWGSGTGDGWPYAAALLGAVGVVSTIAAVVVGEHVIRRRLKRLRRRRNL
jgi:hypothetical protein